VAAQHHNILWSRGSLDNTAATLQADGSPLVVLSDAGHSARAYLLLGKDGFPTFSFAQPNGHLRMVMSDGSGTIPGITFYDNDFAQTWAAP
jgi:hypothetical protein